MRRAARPLLYAGVLVVVFGLAQIHARFIGDYSFTGTSRFGWTIAYAGILCVFAYGFGLPDVPARAGPRSAGVGAAFLGAAAISVLQLLVGDALLPRFVVFGAALLLPDWYRLCVGSRSAAAAAAEARDRVRRRRRARRGRRARARAAGLAGAPGVDRARASRIDEAAAPGTGGSLEQARDGRARPCSCSTARPRTTTAVVAQAAALHAQGVRVRTLSLFYEEWLGKLPVSELERASLLFDIGELHRARLRPGQARSSTSRWRWSGCVALVVVMPVRVARQPASATGGRCSTARSGSARAASPSRSSSSARWRRDAGGELVNEWTTEDDPRITPLRPAAAQDPPRRAAPGRQHPARRPRRRRAPSRAAALRRRADRQAALLRRCATSSGPASPAGPR